MYFPLLVVLLVAAVAAQAPNTVIDLSQQTIQVKTVNGRTVQSAVVRTQIWVRRDKNNKLLLKDAAGNNIASNFAVSLQDPRHASLLPCDGTQTVSVTANSANTFAINNGEITLPTADLQAMSPAGASGAKEFYLCLSATSVSLSATNVVLKNYFNIDTLFSVWVVHDDYVYNNVKPCACDANCFAALPADTQCTETKLTGPVAPPIASRLSSIAGLNRGFTPSVNAFSGRFTIGIPRTASAAPKYNMPVLLTATGVYATKGPFTPEYWKNGGWTVAFVSATSCTANTAAGTIESTVLNWKPDNRSTVYIAGGSAAGVTLTSGQLGWVEISANAGTTTASQMCLGVAATGQTPVFSPAQTADHEFEDSSYNLRSTTYTLPNFGGASTDVVSGAIQKDLPASLSATLTESYQQNHVNVEISTTGTTFDNSDSPVSVNGATVLISLQRGGCGNALTGQATPTFVEVRTVPKLTGNAATATAADWEFKAFARLYAKQLAEPWERLFVCQAVVPVWYHRFNAFGTNGVYSNPHQGTNVNVAFSTPLEPSMYETALASHFVATGKFFTVIPKAMAPTIAMFGKRAGTSNCDAVAFVEEDGNQGIPVQLNYNIFNTVIGSDKISSLVDVVAGIAYGTQCYPTAALASPVNYIYDISRMPQRVVCTGTGCTWSALQGCNFGTAWQNARAGTPALTSCYNGGTFTYPNPTLAVSGAAPIQLETKQGANLCYAVVPKLSSDAGWTVSGYDYNDFYQGTKNGGVLILHSLLKASWAAKKINNGETTHTTGLVLNKATTLQASLTLTGFSGSNCVLESFDVTACSVRGTLPATLAAGVDVCQQVTVSGADCGRVTTCSAAASSAAEFFGWATVTAVAKGEQLICYQVSSSYGYDADSKVASTVANMWAPSGFSTTRPAKSPLTPTATNGLFFVVEDPSISLFGGETPASGNTIGNLHETNKYQKIPVEILEAKLMPVITEFTMTPFTTARASSTLRIPVVDLAVTIRDSPTCTFSTAVSFYSNTAADDTFVGEAEVRTWASTITGSTLTNWAYLNLDRPGYATRGPTAIYGKVCAAWIPNGFSTASPSHECLKPIERTTLNYETSINLKYSQVVAPARINFIRSTCGSVGSRYFKVPVFAYNAANADISKNFKNVSIYVSLQTTCSGVLPPLNIRDSLTSTVATYPYTNVASLAVQAAQSISSHSIAYPSALRYENGQLYYVDTTHHYGAHIVCTTLTPSWVKDHFSLTAVPATSTLSSIFTATDGSRSYGTDTLNVFHYRLGASDFNTAGGPFKTVAMSDGTVTSKFHAVPPMVVPALESIAGTDLSTTKSQIFIPTVSNTFDQQVDSRITLFPGTPRLSLTFAGGWEREPIGPIDNNFRLAKTSCDEPLEYNSSYADRTTYSVPVCCNNNITRYLYATAQYSTGSVGSAGMYLQLPLTSSFEVYNNDTNAANTTQCYKMCRSINACGETAIRTNFTDVNVDICFVPERLVRTQVPQLTPIVLLDSRRNTTIVNFTSPAALKGLCPYISFQPAQTCASDWTTVPYAYPIPLKQHSSGDWYLSPANLPSTFWTGIRANTAALVPCLAVTQCNTPTGNTENTASDSVVDPSDFKYTATLRSTLKLGIPSTVTVFAPQCNEYRTFLETSLPLSSTSCTSFLNNRACPTVANIFGKAATGPRFVSESSTLLKNDTRINMAAIVGEGTHNVTISGYHLDRMVTWVSLQPITSVNRPCTGATALTGVSTARKVTLGRNCDNTIRTTDVWGIGYPACPEQHGTFEVTMTTTDLNKEYAVCIAFIQDGVAPTAIDFDDQLDLFGDYLTRDDDTCPLTSCAHPISLHVLTYQRVDFTVGCVGGSCSSTSTTVPVAGSARLPIQVTYTSNVHVQAMPDIWVSFVDGTSTTCTGNDIVTSAFRTCNTYTAGLQTKYYPVKVDMGFSPYNPGIATTGNHSILLDGLRTGQPGALRMCYAVLPNGAVPQAAHFVEANGARNAPCTINRAYRSENVVVQSHVISACNPRPNVYVHNINIDAFDVYVSLQESSKGCSDIMSLTRGSAESAVKVNNTQLAQGGYYIVTIPKQSDTGANTGKSMTACVAQVPKCTIPMPADFVAAVGTIQIVTPSAFKFPSVGVAPTFTCDPTLTTCTDVNTVGFRPCKERSTDSINNCVYATAGCDVARCTKDGKCASNPIPVKITGNLGGTAQAVTEGCTVTITSTNYFQGNFTKASASLSNGELNFNTYYQAAGKECNSYVYVADCGCPSGLLTNNLPFTVKTQVPTNVTVTNYPAELYLPVGNTANSQYAVGFNLSKNMITPVRATIVDDEGVSLQADSTAYANMTAVPTACTLTSLNQKSATCDGTTCITISSGNKDLIGSGGVIDFDRAAVLNASTSNTGCLVKLLITYTFPACRTNSATRVFYTLSDTISVVNVTGKSAVTVGSPLSIVNFTAAPVPLITDATFATPAPTAFGQTRAPVAPVAAYESAVTIPSLDIPSNIASYTDLPNNFGTITNFQVCPQRHVNKCQNVLNISMILNSPSERKNDGSGSNPEIVIRFPIDGQATNPTCRISGSAATKLIGHTGFDVAPATVTWNQNDCTLVLTMGCAQVTGYVSFTVDAMTINVEKGNPGKYPFVLVRNRDSSSTTSPPVVLMYTENPDPTCDEVGNYIGNFDVNVRDDGCGGKANLEICMDTTNEIQSAGYVTVDFQPVGGAAHFTHAAGNVRVKVLRVNGTTTLISNASAEFTPGANGLGGSLKVWNRGDACWGPGHLCFKVHDFVVPSRPVTDPGLYCAKTFTPGNVLLDEMMQTNGQACENARSDTVNAIFDLRVSTPTAPTMGDINFPLSFSFTLSEGLAPTQCVSINVPYFKNDNGRDLPLILGRTDAVLEHQTNRFYEVIDGFNFIRSEHNANPSRFFNAKFTNNNCGGKLELCTSCRVGMGTVNGTNRCTALKFTVGGFYAPKDSGSCTQASFKPFSTSRRAVDWSISTFALTKNDFNKEDVFPLPILGGAMLNITHTYARTTDVFPYQRYAREAHADQITLFSTFKSAHSLNRGDQIKIQFPCTDGQRYFASAVRFENSPRAWCPTGAGCTHSCLQNPTWDQTNNVLTLTVICPIQAGSTTPFAVAPFAAPLLPAAKEDIKFSVTVTNTAGVVVESATNIVALTHNIEGISNFNVVSSSCVPGAATNLTISATVSRTITNGVLVIVFPENTFHPSYSALLRQSNGARTLNGVETLLNLPVLDTTGSYDAYWRNNTGAVSGDRESVLFIVPKVGRKFSSTTISVNVSGLVNPWSTSWRNANNNPSGAYRGNWQFKRIEYRADAFNANDGSIKGLNNWYLDNSVAQIHLPVLRTADWYGVDRTTRSSVTPQLAYLYVSAPQPFWNPAATNVLLNYPTLTTVATANTYVTEKLAASVLAPASLSTGIRELSVVPSNRTLGGKGLYLDISFKTCASLGRSGRIDISFGVQTIYDSYALVGSTAEPDTTDVQLRSKVTLFEGNPFVAFEGPVSVEDLTTTGRTTYQGYFKRMRDNNGREVTGGILTITGFNTFTCGEARSDAWSFRVGRLFGQFQTNTFEKVPQPLKANCLDPGYYHIATYSEGCTAAPLTCGGSGNTDRTTCGVQLVETSTFMNPTTDELTDDSVTGRIEYVDLTGDLTLGSRLPCAIDNILRFTASFRKRVTEGDTIEFALPIDSFSHPDPIVTITEVANATYRPLLSRSAAWNQATRTLTVTIDRSFQTCSRIAGGECITNVVFTADGFTNPIKPGRISTSTVTVVTSGQRFTSAPFTSVTVDALQFTATLLNPKVRAQSGILFELPSIPCYVQPGSTINIKLPNTLKLLSGPWNVQVENVTISATRAENKDNVLSIQLPKAPELIDVFSIPNIAATCAVNNARRLLRPDNSVGLAGKSKNCGQYNTKDTCAKAGCLFDCSFGGSLCFDGNAGRQSVTNFIVASQHNQLLNSGFRLMIENVVKVADTPGDAGVYELLITDDKGIDVLSVGQINPSNENVEENTDLIQGISNFDIKPAGDCTWSVGRERRSVALELSFYVFGTRGGGNPGTYTNTNPYSAAGPYTISTVPKAGRMHELKICFPETDYTYTYVGRSVNASIKSYQPVDVFGTPEQCAAGTQMDYSIPIQFQPLTANQLLNGTVHIPIVSSLYSNVPNAVRTCALVDNTVVERRNSLIGRWDNGCVVIQTYENLVGGKYTFILGESNNMNGFTQRSPIDEDARNGLNVNGLGPKSGILRNVSDNKYYNVTLSDRRDDIRDSRAGNIDPTTASTNYSQCAAAEIVYDELFIPPSDAVRSGIADFDVVPSKASPSAEDVWLTFSLTFDKAITTSGGMDIIFPPNSWYRPLQNKCGDTPIEVEILTHTQKGTPSLYSKEIMASASWIINANDYKNQQTNGVRDLKAGVLRLNFTRSGSVIAVEPGYLVFRVGGWINPPRVGDPSRPTSGPYGHVPEYWSGFQWYNNPALDWKVVIFEYNYLLKTTTTLSQTESCGSRLDDELVIHTRGSMNAPSDWIGDLYCGPEGIQIGSSTRKFPFDVIPSRNSINSAEDEKNVTLEFSMCIRRDIPAGSRIVIRLPEDSFTAPTCGSMLEVTSDDSNALGLKNAKVFVDRDTVHTSYDDATANMLGTAPSDFYNPNGPTTYGFNRYEPELVSTQTDDNVQHTEVGSYTANTNDQYGGRTITIIVGEGGVLSPERPKWYHTSATNTLTSTDKDQYGERGPTGARLFTFRVSGFQAPCSVKTYTDATGEYESQDLETGDLGEYDVRVEFGDESLWQHRVEKAEPCVLNDAAKQAAFTMKNYYTSANDALWNYLSNDNADNLYPYTERLLHAKEHPDILEVGKPPNPQRRSNFARSPANPPSDAVWGISDSYNFNFELKILNVENDRKCGTGSYNKDGTGVLDPNKYKLGSDSQRLEFSLELPSCFVSRQRLTPANIRRKYVNGVKFNENDGDKLSIKFPANTFKHKCGRVDLTNVPSWYENNLYTDTTTVVNTAMATDPWTPVLTAGSGNRHVRITENSNYLATPAGNSPVVPLLSADWVSEDNLLNVYGPLADWRISQPKNDVRCGVSRRHIVKFQACCFTLPENYTDPGNFEISYKKRTKRNEELVNLLSQGKSNPMCDAVPNPASCQSMWGGCSEGMKECTTGMGADARCICIPKQAQCCNASHGWMINRNNGEYVGNAAAGDAGGVRAYCDWHTEVCESYEYRNWGSRCSAPLYMPPRARGLSIAVPLIIFGSIVISLIVVIVYAKASLGSIIAPLILGVLICAFSIACLLSVLWYTALGFACLAIFNIFAAHPEKNSRYMLVCLIVEGLMLLSYFSTGKVIPTRTARTLIPVYPGEESECVGYYGFYGTDTALIWQERDSIRIAGRRLCSRSWLMTLDIFFAFIIALFVLIWFVNLYFYMRQKEAETKERRERRARTGESRDVVVRTLTANNGALTNVEEIDFKNDAVEQR